MNIVLETDIGRDLDDFLAICLLAEHPSVNLRGVVITPGDPDQIALTKWTLSYLGLPDVIVGSVPGRYEKNKHSVSGVHLDLLKKLVMVRPKSLKVSKSSRPLMKKWPKNQKN